MGDSPNKLLEAGSCKISFLDCPQKMKSPWCIPTRSDTFYGSSDASLFSSSLPVLPHEKLKSMDSEDVHQTSDDTSSKLNKLHDDVDIEESLEDTSIGILLPGDEEELLAGIVDGFDLAELPTQVEDLEEYDVFGNAGGMELEYDSQDKLSRSMAKMSLGDGSVGNVNSHYGFQNGVVVGEHPYGEHPSRTLFVRNINSNVEDSELRSLFEQYGAIRTLYTACKHRGFVMVSYYDIRAARTAMRALQNKPLRRRKLDIHFSIPKDNPSDKDINQGTLVVFNLDPSVSNDDLRQIFGAYGEVKEIRETPHKRHHKFVEFYDVRAAEAALRSLNRSDIAGKRIKLEPSRPGGARRNLMQQMGQEVDHDDSRIYCHQAGSPVTNSSPIGNWVQFGSVNENDSLHGLGHSPVFGTINHMGSNHLPGLASILPPGVPSAGKVVPVGKDQGVPNMDQSFQYSHSFPEHNSSTMSHSPGRSSAFVPSTSNSSRGGTLGGPHFLWDSPYTEHKPAAWLASSMSNPFTVNIHGQGISHSGRQGTFINSHLRHHVGSAPSVVPFERRYSFLPESPEPSFLNPVAYGGMGLNCGERTFHAAKNTGVDMPRNVLESSSGFSVMPTQRVGPMFLGFGGQFTGSNMGNVNGYVDRNHNHNRRTENNTNQMDSKKQYQLDLDKISSGEDKRTTLMIKNIPNKYTSKMLLAAIDEHHQSTYDFLYLPIDFKNKCNVGYAFINMISPSHIIPFYEAFNGKKWEKFNSEKVASLAYARIQGKAALVSHFQNSSLMNEDKRCRPILFHSEWSEADQVIHERHPLDNAGVHIQKADCLVTDDHLESSTRVSSAMA